MKFAGLCIIAALALSPAAWADEMPPTPATYCRPFPKARIQPAPGGYHLLDRQGNHDGRVVPKSDKPSPNGQFWICQPAGEPVNLVLAPRPAS